MAADVEVAHLVVEHVDALAEEVVDRLVEELLVAGNRRGAQHHRVALAQADLPVVVDAHAHHGAGRFTLAARGDDDDFVRRQVFHLVRGQQLVLGDVQVAELDGDAHVVDHGAADDADPAVVLARHVDDLLHAADVGGERRQQHTAVGLAEHLVQHLLHRALAGGGAFAFGVGGIGQEQHHAFVAPTLELVLFRGLVVHGRRVKAVVAGVDDPPQRRVDAEADAVGEAVGGVEELHGEDARFDDVVVLDGVQLRLTQQLVLAQLDFHQAAGQRRGIDGRAQPFFHQV